MLWQFFSLPGIENGIEYRYFSRYRIEVRNSSIVTTLFHNITMFSVFKVNKCSLDGLRLRIIQNLPDHTLLKQQYVQITSECYIKWNLW